MFWRIYPIAIVLGLAAGSVVAAVVSALGLLMFSSGEADAFVAVIAGHTGFHVASLAGSVASSLSAGWVAARFAFGEEVVNAIVTGALLVTFGIASYLKPAADDLPGWVAVASFGLALPLSLVGALLYRGRLSAA